MGCTLKEAAQASRGETPIDNFRANMGEIADWLIGQQQDLYGDFPFCNPEPKVCYRCGRTDLIWLETKKGWRLSQDGETVHACTPDVTNLFDVVEEEN